MIFRRDPEPVGAGSHAVLGTPMRGPFDDHLESLVVGMGCFWGAERFFWQIEGVHTTAAGYSGGHTAEPTYEETCTGTTGHTEAVLVVFDPSVVSVTELMKVFWENHDPTTLNRQGNDRGTQYRSAVFTTTDAQMGDVLASRDAYQAELTSGGFGDVTTEIAPLRAFYYAEDYHQQYLDKNPSGYCNHGFCQVSFPAS